MRRVLVTGASGFIGRHSLHHLVERGYEVHALSSQSSTVHDGNAAVHWHTADLLDPDSAYAVMRALEPTHLLHLAWYVNPSDYRTSSKQLRWLEAGVRLVAAFHDAGGRRLVVAGTCFEYDARYGYCREELTPLAPSTLYGTCKQALSTVVEAFSAQTDLSSAWGRVFFLYGPHEHPDRLVPYVVRSLLRGERARCSHGDQLRDFLFVDDVASALAALVDSDVQGAVNVGSGRPTAIRQVLVTIARQLGREDLLGLGEREPAAGEPQLLVANSSRLNDEVQWQPAYDLAAGIEQTVAWWAGRLTASASGANEAGNGS